MNLTRQEGWRGRKVIVRAVAFGCVLIVVMIGGLFAGFWKNYLGPAYQGRKLADWVNDLPIGDEETTSSSNRERYEAAVKAVRHFGTNALPLALRLCQVENSSLELNLMQWCDDFNLRQNALHIDYGISYAEIKWQQGLGVFRALGSNATPAIPLLIDYLNRDNSAAAGNATAAFHYIGPESIPPLLVVLANSNKQTRRLAGFSLSHFGTNSIAATPVLLQYIQGERGALADMAAYALAKVNDDPTVVVPALTHYLRTTADRPNSEIFSKLGSYGTNAASAVPVLIEFIETNRRPNLVPRAISALSQIDSEKGIYYRAKRDAGFKSNQPPSAVYDHLKPSQTN